VGAALRGVGNGSYRLRTRAGQDQFGNDSLDAFVAAALCSNISLTLMNHPNGPHAFDLLDDSDASHEIVAAILAFLRAKLSV